MLNTNIIYSVIYYNSFINILNITKYVLDIVIFYINTFIDYKIL